MTIDPSKPVRLTKDELLETLYEIVNHVKADDSFGGFLEYDCLDPDLPPDVFYVRAGYRIGNSEGQGGMRFVTGDTDDGGTDSGR